MTASILFMKQGMERSKQGENTCIFPNKMLYYIYLTKQAYDPKEENYG